MRKCVMAVVAVLALVGLVGIGAAIAAVSGCQSDAQTSQAVVDASAVNTQLDAVALRLHELATPAAGAAGPTATQQKAEQAAEAIDKTKTARDAAIAALNAWQNAEPGTDLPTKLTSAGVAAAPMFGPLAPYVVLGVPLVMTLLGAVNRQVALAKARAAAQTTSAALKSVVAGAQQIVDAAATPASIGAPPVIGQIQTALATHPDPQATGMQLLGYLQGTNTDRHLDALVAAA